MRWVEDTGEDELRCEQWENRYVSAVNVNRVRSSDFQMPLMTVFLNLTKAAGKQDFSNKEKLKKER